MPGYHHPNPLDLVFFAIDQAWRRCGLPGADIHWYFELEGQLDVEGLRRALRSLFRIYPVLGGRLLRSPLTGKPTWRLDDREPDLHRVVRVFDLTPPTREQLQIEIERRLASRVDPGDLPPLRFDILRGLPTGDFVILRWPHALMDARGGVTVIETLARLYDEAPDPASLASAGDEQCSDFGSLSSSASLAEQLGMILGRRRDVVRPPNWHSTRLCPEDWDAGGERIRFCLRHLSPDQAAQVRAVSTQVCGFARVNDFVRASAIRALHEIMHSSAARGTGYSTLQMFDNRKRRDPRPVCHNVFSSMPVFVPTELAERRAAVADLFHESAGRLLTSGAMESRLAGLKLLARLPTSVLAAIIERGLRTGRSILPIDLANPPSLPMRFMNLLTKPIESFCGARWKNLYGIGPVSPRSGFAIAVSTAQERMNITSISYEPRVSVATMETLLDRLVELMLTAD